MTGQLYNMLLNNLPTGSTLEQLYIGSNWTISVVQNRMGDKRAGLAATPSPQAFNVDSRFKKGYNNILAGDPTTFAALAKSPNQVEAAIGLATINALMENNPSRFQDIDAADWLAEQSRSRRVALVGRFPFIDELKAVTSRLWVLELAPRPGEYGSNQAHLILPQADVIAITSSTIINHTLETLLQFASTRTKVMLLGPSTPMSPSLFDFNIDLLSGVQVVNVEAAIASVAAGVNFRKMMGVRRVTLKREGA